MDLASLPTAAALAHGPGFARWRPGLEGGLHSEVFADGGEASGTAAALALALDGLRSASSAQPERSVLWVQDAASLKLNGRPYSPGLPHELRRRLIHIVAPKPEDALFALEEGVRCRDLVCVIGEILGNPKALDFTASRRLTLAAEKHGVPLFLVRLDADRDLSSARMRWQVRAAHSPPPQWNPAAPGRASWHAELFRARSHAPGEWILTYDGQELVAHPAASQEAGAPHHGDLASAAGDRPLATF
jgi:protein ImuA